jgi:hypothetical protein
MGPDEFRTLMLTTAAVAALVMLTMAILQMERQTRRIEVIVTKADLAASQVWDVIEEARRITQQAAEDTD